MAVVSPSNRVQEAVKYVSEAKTANPEKKLSALIDEAAMKYDLTPAESDSLFRILTSK